MSNNTWQKKILYVDDDHLSLISLQRLFQKELCIDIAINSEEAIELVSNNNYDAILMDIGFKNDINGVELTKKIRKINNYANVPVIALTAYASKDDRNYILSNGIDYYIAKPFFKNDLLDLLKDVFSEQMLENYSNLQKTNC